MSTLLFPDQDVIQAKAYFLGQSIDLTPFSEQTTGMISPLMTAIGESGQAVVFDYGAFVLFGASPCQEATFLERVQAHTQDCFERPETETVMIRLTPANAGKVENGVVWLSQFDPASLQLVAEVLAKSVVLAHYETGAAQVFDQIEPFAVSLQQPGQNRHRGQELLKQIGNTLLIQHKTVGRVEIIDKPELLWEYPELDRLYLRLEDEYEIRERHSALDRKLELVARTAETALDLQQQNTGLRLELYVVILIVIEVILSLYELFIRG